MNMYVRFKIAMPWRITWYEMTGMCMLDCE